MLQKYAGFPIVVKKLFTEDWSRFKGYHSHPLRFAGYLSTIVIIAYSFGIFYKRYFLYFAFMVFTGIILNGSRTYWLSVCFTLGIISLIKSKKIFLYTLLIYGLVFLSSYIFLPEISNRVKATYNPEYGINNLSNMQFRKNFWKASIEISSKNPIYGIGAKKVSQYLEYYKEKGLIDNTAHCHNIYITNLAEAGIIGLGIMVFIIFYFLKKYIILFKNSINNFSKAFTISLFGCWLNVSISVFFENNFSTFVLWGFLSVWMGLFEGYIRKQTSNKNA